MLLAVLTAVFVLLGLWQVQRMGWKHALIAKVDARIHAAPVSLPGEGGIAAAGQGGLDYLRVRLAGTYLAPATALVRASSERGLGYWAMTPLRLDDGRTIWVNRGFLPAGTALGAARASVPGGPVSVIGLLRSSEPGGSMLQSNRPADDRWYSRDVAALSRARGAGQTLPLFVDSQAEQSGEPGRAPQPAAGLTTVHFPDNHLSYALTWFAMALLSVFGIWLAWRRGNATPA
ncbi:SURF1 family protein [Novosphingobium flavum]|uniref:SURF1 family protein n=1 Tax=Novosphingobium flavum TaxID=1778672 RepID=UPI0031B62E0E